MALAARGSMLALVVRSALADVRLREGVQELLEILPVPSGMVNTLPNPQNFPGKIHLLNFPHLNLSSQIPLSRKHVVY